MKTLEVTIDPFELEAVREALGRSGIDGVSVLRLRSREHPGPHGDRRPDVRVAPAVAGGARA